MTQDEIKRICEKRFLELGANKIELQPSGKCWTLNGDFFKVTTLQSWWILEGLIIVHMHRMIALRTLTQCHMIFLKQTFWNKLICCCLNNTNITTPSLCKGWRDSQ